MLDTQPLIKASKRARIPVSDSLAAPASVPGKVDIQALLAPVERDLRRVEAKMKSVDSTLFAPLASAFVDLIGSGGKRIRPALALMGAEFNGTLRGTPEHERVIALAASVEMLHTATLVHDDVIDDALLRRGAPTLNAHWSKGSTVLAGNYMFGRAAYFSAETESTRVIHIFSDTLQVIVNGELRQLFARNNFYQDKQQYYQRIYAKTASLFCAATEGAAVLSNVSAAEVQSLHDYGYNLGMAFQIVDDILDFTGNAETLGKPAGSDLRQGTLTLPFFYFLQEHPSPDTLVADLIDIHDRAEEEESPDLWHNTVAAVVQQLQHSGAVDAARHEALTFLDRARHSLQGLPDNRYKESMLGLCDFVVQRTH